MLSDRYKARVVRERPVKEMTDEEADMDGGAGLGDGPEHSIGSA